jgi:hypothetical protein
MDASQASKFATYYDDVLLKVLPQAQVLRHQQPESLVHQVEHLRWMLHEVEEFLAKDNTLRAIRWIGYVEGSMVQLKLLSVSEIQYYSVLSGISND